LVDRRRIPEDKTLPGEFVAFWKVLCQTNQRKCAPAYRSLFLDHLCAGRQIAGYGGDWRRIYRNQNPGWPMPEECPYSPYDTTPHGWSYNNLMRYAPDIWERTAARVGPAKASDYLPKLPTTRAGLELGQFFVVDDVYHDIRVNFLGNREAQIPLELGALELLSGHYCVWALKPVRERNDGTREHLKENYMRYLLAHLLCRIGVHPGGCTILCEHGTATARGPLEKAIAQVTQGTVRFEAGGVHGAPIAKGLYEGRPRGNYRWKAALESHHNLKHNELAGLEGQRGKDRDHSPEENYGRDRENKALLKACAALADRDPLLMEKLRAPFVLYQDFARALGVIYDRIASRTHHELEGFDDAGLTVCEFRLARNMPWLPVSELSAMPPAARTAIETLIEARPALRRIRPMSPIEAFRNRAAGLKKFPECCVPDIMGRELGRIVKVNDRKELVIPDVEVPGKTHSFAGIARNGHETDLERGSTWLVHVSPFGADEAFISRVDGGFVGIAPALQRVCRTDAEGMQRNLGVLSHVLHKELARLGPIADARARERAENTAHNISVFRDAQRSMESKLTLGVDLEDGEEAAAIAGGGEDEETQGEPATADEIAAVLRTE
jgi:hypothetical protein